MKKIFRLLLANMDLFRFVVILLVVGNLVFGGILVAQWNQKRTLLDQIEKDQSTISDMMNKHTRLREMFSYLQTDKLAGEARGELIEYVLNASNAAMIPQPGNHKYIAGNPRNVGSIRVREKMLDLTWQSDSYVDRPVGDGPWRDSVRGGFTQNEILTLLYYLEKNSERVKVNQLSLKPFKAQAGGRVQTLQKEEPNEFWRWSITKLTIIMRTLEGSGTG